MSDTQVKGIIDKFEKDHSERCHEQMHTVALIALKQACEAK
jgi:hypothetical protein